MIAFGFSVLRQNAQEFWTTPLCEMIAVWRGFFGETPPPLSRATLDSMMAKFPDSNGFQND